MSFLGAARWRPRWVPAWGTEDEGFTPDGRKLSCGDVGCWWLLPRQQASRSSFRLLVTPVFAARDLLHLFSLSIAPAAASPSVLTSLHCFCSPSAALTPSPPGVSPTCPAPAHAGQGAGPSVPAESLGCLGLWHHAQISQPNKIVFLCVSVLQFLWILLSTL